MCVCVPDTKEVSPLAQYHIIKRVKEKSRERMWAHRKRNKNINTRLGVAALPSNDQKSQPQKMPMPVCRCSYVPLNAKPALYHVTTPSVI